MATNENSKEVVIEIKDLRTDTKKDSGGSQDHNYDVQGDNGGGSQNHNYS